MTQIDGQLRLRARNLMVICATTLIFSSTIAVAEKRMPAPISYAATGSSADTGRSTASNRQAAASTNASSRRFEYRYPDDPSTIYGAGGIQRSVATDPIAFSSEKAVIVPTAAQQYAHATPSRLQSAPTIARDPAITAGGFDARAAAAQTVSIRNQAAIQPIAATVSVTERPVSGEVFNPAANAEYDRTGMATLIAKDLQGKPTANGEVYNGRALSAAHPTLPLPSLVHVINSDTGRETVVRVNDRGPIAGGGLIELSDRAAEVLGIKAAGEGRVRVRYLGPAPATAPEQAPFEFAQAPVSPVVQAPPPSVPPSVTFPAARQVGTFFVQLGSFSDISNAQRLHGVVEQRSQVKVVPVNVRGNDFFRVLAGPFVDRGTASAVRDELANQGVADGVVVSSDK